MVVVFCNVSVCHKEKFFEEGVKTTLSADSRRKKEHSNRVSKMKAFIPDSIHTANIIQTEQVLFRNRHIEIYMHTHNND